VELDDSCAVKAIKNGVRKYVTPVSSAARSFALEGEREIDKDNPKVLIFHLQGPTRQVMLYLRAFKFSSLYYTELGRHSHEIDFDTKLDGDADAHTHDLQLGELETSEEPEHSHTVGGNIGAIDGDGNAFDVCTAEAAADLNQQVGLTVSVVDPHFHTLKAATLTTDLGGELDKHKHAVEGDTEPTGQPVDARVGAELEYVKNLTVIVDGQDLTPAILNHLGWTELGSGDPTHELVTLGTTMGIPLDQLGLDPKDGQHVIELRVAEGGGTIQYNLYVE
jgi:hypothetical protein